MKTIKKLFSEHQDDIRYFIIPLLFIIVFACYTGHKRSIGKAKRIGAQPAEVFVADGNVEDGISDWAVGEDAIYVYYHSSHRVDVFDKAGVYSFSIQLPAYSTGVGGIGIKDGLLYVQDEDLDTHIFEGKDYIECIPNGAGPRIDTRKLDGKDGYKLVLGQIINKESGDVLLDLRTSSVYLNYGKYVILFLPAIIWKVVTDIKTKKVKHSYVLREHIDPYTGKITRIKDDDTSPGAAS